MKKIFTLISVVLFAGGAMAQVEKWDASSLTFDETTKVLKGEESGTNNSAAFVIPKDTYVFPEGTFQNYLTNKNLDAIYDWLENQADPTVYTTSLKEYTFTASTDHVTLKAVSTPNNDSKTGEEWQQGSNSGNQALDTDDCPIKWTNFFVKPKSGNPSLGSFSFYDYNSDGDAIYRVADQLWSVGCGQLPQKGCYYEFACTKTDELIVGVYLTQPNKNAVVVVEKDSKDALPISSLKFEGYCQNNTYSYNEKTYQTFSFRDDYTIDVSSQANRPLLGYLSFPVEAGKTYLVFMPSTQLGLYGFQLGKATDGIETIAAASQNSNAAIYNLAGQQVAKSYKGVVIQNGKKFVQK